MKPIIKQMTDSKKSFFTVCVIAVSVLISVSILCVSYVKSLNQTLIEESKSYILELANHEKIMLEQQVTDNLNKLSVTAKVLQTEDIMSVRNMSFLQRESNRQAYKRMFVVFKDGICKSTDGYFVDLQAENLFLDGMKGIKNISSSVLFGDMQDTIVYSVPIYEKHSIVGVLGAVYTKQAVQNVLTMGSFQGTGRFYVVNRTGQIIFADYLESYLQYENIFAYLESASESNFICKQKDLQQMKKDFLQNSVGILGYTIDKKDFYMGYTPLEINDWYLLTVVPQKMITGKTDLFVKITILVMIGIILLFSVLILYIIYVHKKTRKKLELIAYIDPITQGVNRAKLELWASDVLKQADNTQYCVVYGDVAKFKLINDTFGHDAGNKTLKYIYECIQKNLKPKELVARISADNYVIFMKYHSEQDTIHRLIQIDKDINSFNVNLENKYYLVCLIGIYIIKDKTIDFSIMIDRANIARQKIIYKGGAQMKYAFYSDKERDILIEEKRIENKMADALKKEEFEIYLQPKCNMQTNITVAAEALVRWNDPDKGLLTPYYFIELFERNGFIVQIDRYVFKKVCEVIHNWLKKGKQPVQISVNLSKAHLNIPNFMEYFETIRQQYEVPTKYIEFELTESMIFQNIERLTQVIQEIHSYGYTCSLDDFGSGYSSLNMLKDVSVDVLKLDRGFFVGSDDKRSRAIISGVISMAKELNMKTVAEGVDTKEQQEFIKQKGCDMMQAFLFAKPMPVFDFNCFFYGTEEKNCTNKDIV